MLAWHRCCHCRDNTSPPAKLLHSGLLRLPQLRTAQAPTSGFNTGRVNYVTPFGEAMKKSSSVSLDKLIEDYSLIEQKISEIIGKNNLLEIQLEKSTRLLKLSETKETSIIEDCGKLKKVTKGLQDAIINQCNLRVLSLRRMRLRFASETL
ncbi:hypothetical protein NDU88_005563 [Pleurodeles waltl]|uniref:Uncharacterized protein n=1 Tax=Pleurodeles waltl TaxID=8319 RepID=A0AAV7WD23_PLEWA|nr:hypothetical protein NDU88_005563 [Pleurodeles waltl]